jgi:hypothetical protein
MRAGPASFENHVMEDARADAACKACYISQIFIVRSFEVSARLEIRSGKSRSAQSWQFLHHRHCPSRVVKTASAIA